MYIYIYVCVRVRVRVRARLHVRTYARTYYIRRITLLYNTNVTNVYFIIYTHVAFGV